MPNDITMIKLIRHTKMMINCAYHTHTCTQEKKNDECFHKISINYIVRGNEMRTSALLKRLLVPQTREGLSHQCSSQEVRGTSDDTQ